MVIKGILVISVGDRVDGVLILVGLQEHLSSDEPLLLQDVIRDHAFLCLCTDWGLNFFIFNWFIDHFLLFIILLLRFVGLLSIAFLVRFSCIVRNLDLLII